MHYLNVEVKYKFKKLSCNYPFDNRKNKHHHWILHVRIILAIKFSLNWQPWFFGQNFPQEGISGLWSPRGFIVKFQNNLINKKPKNKIKTKTTTKAKMKAKLKMKTKTKTKTKMKTKMENKMKTKTKIKIKMNVCFCFHFVFHFRFCFGLCFLKVLAVLSTPRGGLEVP